ncbi:MAG: esterase family protein [Rhodothermales bacterium]|nr:esterase family protein [Rhodothermales bacterium]
MKREYKQWYSPSLGRDMEILVFGHSGTPLLVFPSSLGRYFEWEDFGMIDALADKIESGQNMVICTDSIDGESFYNKHVHPYVRMARHRQFEDYIINEVIPFAQHASGTSFIISSGASFGAYHAANFVFKHPHLFGKLIALSGAYDIKSFLDGFYDDSVYFNNPIDYLPNLSDHGVLENIRKNQIILSYGEFDPCRDKNERLSGILHSKSIPHSTEVISGAFGHDWPWWRQQIRQHIV